jgi:NAD(P)-dependent dehydrogenase (short-subunit alcohol dehydrogenase family)
MFDLKGQVAVVTGGASGIGLAAVSCLARAGAICYILDLNLEAGIKAAETLKAQGLTCLSIGVDVTVETQIIEAFDHVIAQQGRIDVLVNNAGCAKRAPSTELSLDDWNQVINLNMTAGFLCARHAARHMIAHKISGRIINMASIMGLSGGGLYPNISYQTSKGAIINMTRALAIEWAPHKIRVNAIAPTWVNTPFIAGLVADPDLLAAMVKLTPLGRIAQPEDIEGAILFLASEKASAMVTGHTLPVDGGFLAQ